MKEETKAVSLVKLEQGKARIEFNMQLTQSDFVDAAISEQEDKLVAAQDKLKSDMSCEQKKLKALREEISSACNSEANGDAGPKFKKIIESMLTIGRKCNYKITNARVDDVEKRITYHYEVSDPNASRYSNDLFSGEISMRLPKDISCKLGEVKVMVERISVMTQEEFDIAQKLGDVNRFARQAKAQIVRKFLEANPGLAGVMPALPDPTKK